MFVLDMILKVIGNSIEKLLRKGANKALALVLFNGSVALFSFLAEIVDKNSNKNNLNNQHLNNIKSKVIYLPNIEPKSVLMYVGLIVKRVSETPWVSYSIAKPSH